MALTNIPNYKTPSRPIEITFAANFTAPDSVQTLAIMGHFDTNTPVEAVPYQFYDITNISNISNVTQEMTDLFGETCELTLMVIAAVTANVGNSNFPLIKVIGLDEADTDIPDAAKTAIDRESFEYLVSPYDALDTANTDDLKTLMQGVSQADRTDQYQYGSMGVIFNRDTTDYTTLPTYDTQYLCPCIMTDTGTLDNAPVYSVAEMAAAYGAMLAGLLAPFNPLNGKIINGVAAPKLKSDWMTNSGTGDTEVILRKGWTPLCVNPSKTVFIVRSVTSRITDNGSGANPNVGEPYVDAQDFMVLYYLREVLHARFTRADFKQAKASNSVALSIKGEVISILKAFESGGMVQNVDGLAPKVIVQRNATYRSRFDIYLPVNVIPGLHQIATNISATTEGDILLVTI